MLSGPSLILHLEAEEAISAWRRLVGPMLDAKENAPESLRAKFQVGEVNPIHAASNSSQVKLEVDLFFGASDSKVPEATEPEVVANEVVQEEEAAVVEQAAAEEPAAEPAEEPIPAEDPAPAEEPAE